MLFKKSLSVCCDNHTKHKTNVWAECREFNVNVVLHKVTAVLRTVKAKCEFGLEFLEFFHSYFKLRSTFFVSCVSFGG